MSSLQSTPKQSKPHNTVTRDSFQEHILYFSNAVWKWNTWLSSSTGQKTWHKAALVITNKGSLWSLLREKTCIYSILYDINGDIFFRETNVLPMVYVLILLTSHQRDTEAFWVQTSPTVNSDAREARGSDKDFTTLIAWQCTCFISRSSPRISPCSFFQCSCFLFFQQFQNTSFNIPDWIDSSSDCMPH